MKILDVDKLKKQRRYPFEVITLFPILLICIAANALTYTYDDGSNLCYVINNLSWWVGNLCFWLIVLSIIVRTVNSIRNARR